MPIIAISIVVAAKVISFRPKDTRTTGPIRSVDRTNETSDSIQGKAAEPEGKQRQRKGIVTPREGQKNDDVVSSQSETPHERNEYESRLRLQYIYNDKQNTR